MVFMLLPLTVDFSLCLNAINHTFRTFYLNRKDWLFYLLFVPGGNVIKWTVTLISSVQFSHSVVSNSLWPHGLQHARVPCPSLTPGAYTNWHPSSQWGHPTISSSVIPFSSRLQSFPASRSFPVSQFFASGGQSIWVSASTSVHPMNIQDLLPLGLTGWTSLQSKGLSRVFSNTIVQKIFTKLLNFPFFKMKLIIVTHRV